MSESSTNDSGSPGAATGGGPRKPPEAVMRLVNKVPAAILRSPLHRPLSKRLLLLGFTGRRSGKRITIPVGYFQTDDRTLLLATERPWRKNLAGGAPVEVRLRGRTLTGTSDVIDEPDAFAAALEAMLAIDAGYGRFFGVSLAADRRPEPEQVRQAWRRGLRVVRLRLDEAASE